MPIFLTSYQNLKRASVKPNGLTSSPDWVPPEFASQGSLCSESPTNRNLWGLAQATVLIITQNQMPNSVTSTSEAPLQASPALFPHRVCLLGYHPFHPEPSCLPPLGQQDCFLTQTKLATRVTNPTRRFTPLYLWWHLIFVFLLFFILVNTKAMNCRDNDHASLYWQFTVCALPCGRHWYAWIYLRVTKP